MTATEKEIADRLRTLTGQFANFKEGKFVDQLHTWHDRRMTEEGRDYLLRLLDRYSGKIDDAAELKKRHTDEQLDQMY